MGFEDLTPVPLAVAKDFKVLAEVASRALAAWALVVQVAARILSAAGILSGAAGTRLVEEACKASEVWGGAEIRSAAARVEWEVANGAAIKAEVIA